MSAPNAPDPARIADDVAALADAMWADPPRWQAADGRPIPYRLAEIAVAIVGRELDKANEEMGAALAWIKHRHPEVYAEALAHIDGQEAGS